jgi:hypothetical protein
VRRWRSPEVDMIAISVMELVDTTVLVAMAAGLTALLSGDPWASHWLWRPFATYPITAG